MARLITILLLVSTPIFAQETKNSIISANNRFTADLYKEVLKNEEPNFLFSPFSIEAVFALAQSGAKGQTGQELRSGLRLPENQTEIETEFRDIFPKLKSEYDLYSFHSANKLYLDKGFTVKEDFKKTAVESFGADLESVEFGQNVEAAKVINQWVEDKTEKKIKNLIDPDSLDPATVAVLINALYFKGNWSTSFEKEDTKKKDFYHTDKKIAPVDTMSMYNDHKTFNYAESQDLDAKFLELPFQGGDVSMVLALPNERTGIANLEQHIDKVLSFNSFDREYVNISMPKFKTESKIDVKKVLKNLGVQKAFELGGADFTRISDKKLHIDQAVQKSFISVYENGVEAAAATYANFVPFSAHVVPPDPKQFHADHPFIYYIKVNDLIVFAGRVGAPNF